MSSFNVSSSSRPAMKKTSGKKPSTDSTAPNPHSRKRRKLDHGERPTTTITARTKSAASTLLTSSTSARMITRDEPSSSSSSATSPSLASLSSMIRGSLTYNPSQTHPGRYLAIDCEMVGVGPEGMESSLARVSLVNWYGAVQLDAFVRQRERVVDYRTQWSGIREKDLVGAKPFSEVQNQVAELIKDRILVGHAVHNDLKALLLSHPRTLLRDTQIYARKFNLTKSKQIALRHLVKDQIGVTIQEGEHSSVIDARATMAIFRLHKKEWERGVRPVDASQTNTSKKRKRGSEKDEEDNDSDSSPPSQDEDKSNSQSFKPRRKQKQKHRKGISSGLSTVVKRRKPNNILANKTTISRGRDSKTASAQTEKSGEKSKPAKNWWTELPSSARVGAKGSKEKRLGQVVS